MKEDLPLIHDVSVLYRGLVYVLPFAVIWSIVIRLVLR